MIIYKGIENSDAEKRIIRPMTKVSSDVAHNILLFLSLIKNNGMIIPKIKFRARRQDREIINVIFAF